MDWLLPSLISAAVSMAMLVAAYLYGWRRLYAARQRRAQESRILLDIANAVNSTLDLTEVLKRVAQRTAQVCEAHRCTIWLLAEDGEMVTPLMSQFSDGHIDREMWRLFKDAGYPVPVSQMPEVQQVIRERSPLFIPDASASSLPRHWIEPFGVKSGLLVPLTGKERVIGLMGLDHVEEGREFTAEQVDLAMAIAAQAAVAIENARLYETTRRQLARVEALAQASARIVTELDLEKTLAGVVQAGLEALRADRAAVYLYDEAHDRLDVGYAYGLSPEYVQYIQDQFHDVPGYRILQTLAPMWVRDAQSDPEARALWEMARREGFHSYVVLPLQHVDRLIGAMVYYYDGIRTFTEGDQQLCQALANQAAVAIENARL
nr:GAF domain-containing protein [Anaerolineae bacterium]